MIKKYMIKCRLCKNIFKVNYGTVSKEISYEIYSCNYCKNIFSLRNTERLECPKCKNKNLLIYNPHKKENLLFYDNMYQKNVLNKGDYNILKNFWEKMGDMRCPACGKDSLVWEENKL
jgi:hypothetical protein